MIKQLSSMDIYFLTKELKELEGSRIDKIYSLGREEIYLQLYKSGEGKKILRIILGRALFLTNKKTTDEMPSHFCMMLRKNLDGKTLASIEQIEPERILKFTFQSKDEEKILYIEQFAKGNVVLCNSNQMIIDAMLKQRFKERTLLPKQQYKHPTMRYNVFEIEEKNIEEAFKKTKKESIVISLATDLGLGGAYSEEVCILAKIDKSTDPKNAEKKEIEAIAETLKKIQRKKIKSSIVYKDKKPVDITPFDFKHYKDAEPKEFESFNDSIQHYFTKDIKLVEEKKSPYDRQIDEIKRIITEQEETIKKLEKEEEEQKKKGEKIYEQYALVKEVMEEINKASQTHSWEEIKKRLKGHKLIKEINTKEKKIILELD